MDIKDLRREVFKMFYSQQNEEKFDLFKKADACEFLQCLLEIIHFNLNDDDSK